MNRLGGQKQQLWNLCLLGVLVLGGCESPRPKMTLAPAKKAELERLFFNQMVIVHYGTNYTDPFAERKAYLRSLADQGLELAEIALQITRAVGGDNRADAPYERLHQLILQGDLGAKCFFQIHPRHLDDIPDADRSGPNEPPIVILKWRTIQEGAAAGHPACKSRLAWALLTGYTSLGVDIQRGRQLAIEAGDADYVEGYQTLSTLYFGTWQQQETDYEQSLCWETKAVALNVPWYPKESFNILTERVAFERYEGRISRESARFDVHCQRIKDK